MPSDLKPDQVRVRDRVLSVCSHGDCRSNSIWDFATCWEHLTAAEQNRVRERLSSALRSHEDLSNIVLTGADLKGFDFTGAKLSKAFFNGCTLTGCRFVEADLRGAFFGAATLQNADLTRAELDAAVFTGALMNNVRLLAYSLSFGRSPINLGAENFASREGSGRPHINESEPPFAAATYRALKAHFTSIGDYDSGSWASFSERLMQRKQLWGTRRLLAWAMSWLFGTLSGYGEKPGRAFGTAVGSVVLFAALYAAFDMSVRLPGHERLGFLDALCLSAATFAGYSLPDLAVRPSTLPRLVATTEAFLGLFVFGLFIFTLTKRYVAR